MAIVDQMPFLPFTARGTVVDGHFRWRLGARPLDLADWIHFGTDGDAWIAEKTAICSKHHDTVFANLDGVDAESREVAGALCRHLAEIGRPHHLDASLHPLDAAARLVPEDLVLMVERDGQLIFGGGSVCFPNRWDLRSKLGATMAEVHAPVPELNSELGASIDRFLDRLTPDQSYWRLGWGLIDSANGFAPPDRRLPPGTDAPYLRVERETLRRFPQTGCVLFTIRTYLQPLAAAVCTDADGDALARSIAGMRETIRDYKDIGPSPAPPAAAPPAAAHPTTAPPTTAPPTTATFS